MTKQYYALISGGKDSMTLAHYLQSQGLLKGVVAFNTDIHVEDWLDWMEKKVDYPIEIIKTPEVYERIVRQYGFARNRGIGHRLYFNYLKDRCVTIFKRKHDGEEYRLATGVRKFESQRRFKNTKKTGSWHSLPVDSPLYYWHDQGVWDYIRNHDIKLAPGVYTCHHAYDCVCGAYAHVSERTLLKTFYPETWERIEKLQDEVGGYWGLQHLPRMGLQGNQRLGCSECATN